MEACFLSSRSSFTNTIELVPSTKTRIFSHSKQDTIQYQRKRVVFPSTVTCSHQGSYSSMDDELKPRIRGDWRTFRARLVAAEKRARAKIENPLSSSSSSSSSSADLDEPMDQPPTFILGETWAHTIPEPEKGCLLVATDKLDGVHIFERTVILLLSTGGIGPTGVILNRPSLMSIKEMRSPALDASGTFANKTLYFGGPLDEGMFILSPEGSDDGLEMSGVFKKVMNGMYYGSKEDVGCAAAMVKRNVVGTQDFTFFDGHCGWEREQLNEEIRSGFWIVAASSKRVINLASDCGVRLWEGVLELLDPRKVY